MLVIANVSGQEARAELPDAAQWVDSEVLLGNDPGAAATDGGVLLLAPWEARVHRRTTTSHPTETARESATASYPRRVP